MSWSSHLRTLLKVQDVDLGAVRGQLGLSGESNVRFSPTTIRGISSSSAVPAHLKQGDSAP